MASTTKTGIPTATPMEVDRTLEQLARWTDYVFRVPGTNFRFGLDAIIGLVPGVGDTASWLASLYILGVATRQGVPRITLLRMALNTAIDLIGGSVPIVGDLFDAWWKSNKRNVELMQRSVRPGRSIARRSRLADWAFVLLIVLILAGILFAALAGTYYILSFLATSVGD